MNFLKRWIPFSISLVVVYFLGYLYQYDFGFSLIINELLTELVHFIVFVGFGFFTCKAICRRSRLQRPYVIYAFGIIFLISIVGVFNEVRVHPEHGANVRDILFHLIACVLGMIIWRLHRIYHEEDMVIIER